MLEFQELTVKEGARLRPYYETCDYRLVRVLAGREADVAGLPAPLVHGDGGLPYHPQLHRGAVRVRLPHSGTGGRRRRGSRCHRTVLRRQGAAAGAVRGAGGQGVPAGAALPRVTVISERPWKDYLYHTEDLAQFAGRRYSGQRNHINKFRRDYPDAAFVALTDPNDPRLTAFWADYEAEFHKTGPLAKQELAWPRRCSPCWIPAGSAPEACWRRAVWWPVSLAEKCGGTLVNHIEKALYSHAGAYPAIVPGLCRLLRRRLRLDQSGGRCQGQGTAHLQAPVPAGGAGRQGPFAGGHGAGHPEAGALPENGAPDPDGPAPFG